MKVVTVRGSFREIGRGAGEELRSQARAGLEIFEAGLRRDPAARDRWRRRLPTMLETAKRFCPETLEEIEGFAEGAGLDLERVLWVNFPSYPHDYDFETGCTNVAFAAGPAGPLLGKNNDGSRPEEKVPPAVVRSYPERGIPTIRFLLTGWIAQGDALNAEGLAMGHSSVGSVFQQSDHHPTIRMWVYEGHRRCKTVAEFTHWMAMTPTRGKGYSFLLADAGGTLGSLEAPCPLVQVRRPAEGARAMNCVNYYQLPALAEADRRSPEGKINARARAKLLEERVGGLPESELTVGKMKETLRYHGAPSVCRHGGADASYTEFSYIAVCREAKALFCDGNPCQAEYQELGF